MFSSSLAMIGLNVPLLIMNYWLYIFVHVHSILAKIKVLKNTNYENCVNRTEGIESKYMVVAFKQREGETKVVWDGHFFSAYNFLPFYKWRVSNSAYFLKLITVLTLNYLTISVWARHSPGWLSLISLILKFILPICKNGHDFLVWSFIWIFINKLKQKQEQWFQDEASANKR